MNYKPRLGEIEFDNPVWIAASPFTERYESIEKCIQSGAGGIVVKSAGVFERKCNRKCENCKKEKRIVATYNVSGERKVESSCTNSEYCERLTIDESNNLVEKIKENFPGFPVIVSFSPEKSSDFESIHRLRGDVIEINSRYFIKEKKPKRLLKYKSTLGGFKELEVNYQNVLSEGSRRMSILKEEIKKLKRPTLLKVVPLYEASLEDQLDSNVSGFTVFDSLKISPYKMEDGFNVQYFGGVGSRSGDPLKWYSYWTIRNIRKDYPEKFISASGGIFDEDDVKRVMEAGANSVQLCSALYFYGYDIIGKLVRALD